MNRYLATLDQLREESRLRAIPPDRGSAELIDLCSNDYMGLASRASEWRDEFASRFGNVSMTASASRLLARDQRFFTMLEEWLSDRYRRPALMFNSGYHANTGLVPALNVPGTLWLPDKLVHASVIDGLRLAGAEFRRWSHNDTIALRRIVEKHRHDYERLIVVCESVYSMDGDIAPLAELTAMKEEFPEIMLYVDEAHAVGCFGETGLGLCDQLGLADKVDVLVGTFGKACASVGAFAVTDSAMREYLVNTARSLIFSTAIAPANAAWTLLMLEKLETMHDERSRLREISRSFKATVESLTGAKNSSESAIVPLITGDSRRAVEISRALEKKGVLALPIRRPTVPPGGERIRFSLSAALTQRQLDHVAEILTESFLNPQK